MPTASGSEVFAQIDGRKNTTSASCRGSRSSWSLVGAGCSNQMQVAQGQGMVRDCTLVQASIGWLWFGVSAFTMAYLRTQSPDLRTDWRQYILTTWARRSLFSRFSSDAIGGDCRPAESLKTWPPILQQHMSEPQSLCIAPESARVLTIVLLTSSSLTASSESHWKPLFVQTIIYKMTFLVYPLYFWQKLTSRYARSPGCDCPLHMRRLLT